MVLISYLASNLGALFSYFCRRFDFSNRGGNWLFKTRQNTIIQYFHQRPQSEVIQECSDPANESTISNNKDVSDLSTRSISNSAHEDTEERLKAFNRVSRKLCRKIELWKRTKISGLIIDKNLSSTPCRCFMKSCLTSIEWQQGSFLDRAESCASQVLTFFVPSLHWTDYCLVRGPAFYFLDKQ